MSSHPNALVQGGAQLLYMEKKKSSVVLEELLISSCSLLWKEKYPKEVGLANVLVIKISFQPRGTSLQDFVSFWQTGKGAPRGEIWTDV